MCTFQPRLLATPKVSISIRTTLEHSSEPVKLQRWLQLLGPLFGACSVVAPQTSFIDGRGDVRAFDFEHRTGLALSEQACAMGLLEADLRII
jgi:hypothetical protein